MSPYREAPDRGEEDGPEVRRWLTLHDELGPLDEAKLWPPPPRLDLDRNPFRSVTVSGDGRRVLVVSNSNAWLLDSETMHARRLPSPPDASRRCVLSDDGALAALISQEGVLFTWRVADVGARPRRIPLPTLLDSGSFMGFSHDGSLLLTAKDSKTATVRVYDVARSELIYSFVANCDEGAAMHPSGEYIVTFGDKLATAWGRDGHLGTLAEDATGGVFDRTGGVLMVSAYENQSSVDRYQVDAEPGGGSIRLKDRRVHRLGRRRTRLWRPVMRFSPDGNTCLVETESGVAFVFLDGSGRSWSSAMPEDPRRQMGIERGSGVLSDNSRVLLSADVWVGHWGWTDPAGGAPLLRVSDGASLGGLGLESDEEAEDLVGYTPIGIFGPLEEEASFDHEDARPYFRPKEIGARLGGPSAPKLDAELSPLVDEIHARDEAWAPFRNEMPPDVDRRMLLELNRGLVHLTPVIVDDARELAEEATRFGPPQLPPWALKRAAEALRERMQDERKARFDAMIEGLRARTRPPTTPLPAEDPEAEAASPADFFELDASEAAPLVPAKPSLREVDEAEAPLAPASPKRRGLFWWLGLLIASAAGAAYVLF